MVLKVRGAVTGGALFGSELPGASEGLRGVLKSSVVVEFVAICYLRLIVWLSNFLVDWKQFCGTLGHLGHTMIFN